MIFRRQVFLYNQNIKGHITRLGERENDQGILITFLNFEEENIEPLKSILYDINQNWQNKLTNEIFNAHKTIILKNLIKANEKLEFRALWNRQFRNKPEVLDIPKNIETIEKLNIEDFIAYSSILLSNSEVYVSDLPIL
ncbi:MAG: hypothetical protein H7196_00855 [candidate division SR1 bacterium]|nr:hypothetical protein [candidate division SR1 bacterium]